MSFRKVIIIFFIFFTSLSFVKAQEVQCPYDEQLRLREIAAAITFSFEFVDYELSSGFDVYAKGMTKDIFIKEENAPVYFNYYEDAQEIKNIGFSPGTTHRLDFYATVETKCPDYKIMSRYLQIPYYNYYSEHPLCKGYEKYDLCQKFSNIYTLIEDAEDFETRMNAYIDSLKSKNNNDLNNENTNNSWYRGVILFLQSYYLELLLTIVIIIIGYIVFTKIKRRRSIL